MSFLDQINHAWDEGKKPVEEGIKGIFSKAKEHEDELQNKNQRGKEKTGERTK